MPNVDIHLIKGGITVDRKKAVTGKTTTGPVAIEGESLRGLTWLTAADVKILTHRMSRKICHQSGAFDLCRRRHQASLTPIMPIRLSRVFAVPERFYPVPNAVGITTRPLKGQT